jgi:glycosyl transferase family (putative galactosyltransferase)
MRKALCSIGAGPHEALLEVSEPTFRAYAERHGYDLVVGREADPRRPPAWTKVRMLQQLLAEFELVVWIDADAVIVDGSGDIADELEPEKQFGLVEHHRGEERIPNTGVMVWRSGDFAHELLAKVWSATRFIDHPWWENAALVDALGYDVPRFSRLERLLPGRPRPCRPARPSRYLAGTQFLAPQWNWAYLSRVENPRIVHCVGVPVEQRLADMRAALEGRLT